MERQGKHSKEFKLEAIRLLNKVNKLEGGDSLKKQTAKMMYSLTPWVMITNAVHGKSLLLTTTVYQLPPGETKILVFNFHLREVNTTTTAMDQINRIDLAMNVPYADKSFNSIPKSKHYYEYGHWGTVVTANLKAGQEYTLSPRVFSAPKTKAGLVSAFVDLLDKNGNNVAMGYKILTPLEAVEMKPLLHESRDFVTTLPAGMQGAMMGAEMKPLIEAVTAETNQFYLDVEQGKYD